MRVAALYDIHGNLPALEAVLTDVEETGADVILVGGDVVSGPMPAETLALLRSLGDRVRSIRGNADRVLDLAGLADPSDPDLWRRRRVWVADQLGDDDLSSLARLPLDVVLDVEGLGPVRFCHGSPGSDEETITRLTPEERLAKLLAGIGERIVVCGHTHIQFDRTVGGIRVVNAGSVGAPYEAEPGAYWLSAGPELSLRRTPYDLDEATSRICASGYPDAEKLIPGLVSTDPERPERMSALIEGM